MAAREKEVVVQGTRGRLVRVASVALLLVLTVNFAVARFPFHYRANGGYWLVYSKWRRLISLAEKAGGLVLGDSSGAALVDVDTCQRELGAPIVNLCTISWMTALNDLYMLQHYLERWGAPRYVVVIRALTNWSDSVDARGLSVVPLPVGFWRDYPPAGFGRMDELNWYYYRYFPLAADFRSLSLFVLRLQPLQGDNLAANGQLIMQPNQSTPWSVVARQQAAEMAKKPFSISPDNQRAMDGFERIAAEHGMQIFLVNPAVFQSLEPLPQWQKYRNDASESIHRLLAAKSHLHYIDFPVVLPDAMMAEPWHSTPEGARLYSVKLAQQLREGISTSSLLTFSRPTSSRRWSR